MNVSKSKTEPRNLKPVWMNFNKHADEVFVWFLLLLDPDSHDMKTLFLYSFDNCVFVLFTSTLLIIFQYSGNLVIIISILHTICVLVHQYKSQIIIINISDNWGRTLCEQDMRDANIKLKHSYQEYFCALICVFPAAVNLKTEFFQQLLDGLGWTVVQTFMFFGG